MLHGVECEQDFWFAALRSHSGHFSMQSDTQNKENEKKNGIVLRTFCYVFILHFIDMMTIDFSSAKNTLAMSMQHSITFACSTNDGDCEARIKKKKTNHFYFSDTKTNITFKNKTVIYDS